jgi:hypothetical protein
MNQEGDIDNDEAMPLMDVIQGARAAGRRKLIHANDSSSDVDNECQFK